VIIKFYGRISSNTEPGSDPDVFRISSVLQLSCLGFSRQFDVTAYINRVGD